MMSEIQADQTAMLKEEEPIFGYNRLSERAVIDAVKELKDTMAEIQQSWDKEVLQYEKIMLVSTMSGTKRLARRNYPNKEGTVGDESLFPYHSACYPLLDAYDGLEEDYTPWPGVVPPVLPHRDDRSSRLHDPNTPVLPSSYLPCSTDAVIRSLQNLSSVPERSTIALKLLKHSMSDMQCDHRMSARVIGSMKSWDCFVDVDVYRSILAIILMERRICNGRCYSRNDTDDDVDHVCRSYQGLEQLFAGAVGTSSQDALTTRHAHLLCAFFKITIDAANPSAGEKEDEIVTNVVSKGLKSRKARLKQALYLWNQTDFDEEESDVEYDSKDIIPYQLLCGILEHLSNKVGAQRCLQTQSLAAKNSFSNSIGALVYIGETAVRRLPAKSDSIEFCSKIVFSFLQVYTGFAYPCAEGERFEGLCTNVCGKVDRVYSQELHFPSVLNPDRYAAYIKNATERFISGLPSHRAVLVKDEASIEWNRGVPRPPSDVFDVVRSLFGRDLVEVTKARCGYGDFLVWLGGEISAKDPFLYVHTYNFPVDVDEEADAWIADETKSKLLDPALFARYDLTLLKLLQAWNSPWSPASHHSFQPQFKAAVRTLVLCAGRVGLPSDVGFHIAKFLPRSAWTDERDRCWCDDCAVDNAVCLMTWKLGGLKPDQAPKLNVTRPCVCQIAMYKSSEHRRKHAGQHRKGCNKIPLRLPGREELLLCNFVDAKLRGEEVHFEEAGPEIGNDEAEDDEGSWESMDTDDEVFMEKPQSVTSVVFDYFNRKSYKLRETEESAFEAMYVREE